MPSWDLFEARPADERVAVLPPGLPTLAVEAASSFGWSKYADDVVSIDRFGESAPGDVALERFGYTPEHVADRARALLGLADPPPPCPSNGPSNGPSRRPRETQPDRAVARVRAEPVVRQPHAPLRDRRAHRAHRPRRHPRGHVEPHDLREGARGRRRLRRAARRVCEGRCRHEGVVLGPRHDRHRERGRPAAADLRLARRGRRFRVGRGRSRSRAQHRRHGEAGRRPVRA